MNDQMPDRRKIFAEAIDIPSATQREAYLDEACGDDDGLRAEIDGLLQAHFAAGAFLDGPAVDPGPTTDGRSVSERPGTVIGRYKLLQEIGEGGMGVVYMAEQTEPVERRVALKIIKLGMDTKRVVARFEAERQALAMMDHPNIAKVLDVGSTESGRPYFVMELVKGVPITQYCDEHRLSPQERLELFIQVCNAVQHAHQKGVIHRDIKPSNVLVALYDGQPVPKVIDFGIAKATSRRLTQKTLFTEFGQIVGTVEYMSPEQAQLNQLDIDTRSDIYSLGVLLYELLVGDTPFDPQRLRTAAFDELLRIIREEEPPKPSTKLEKGKTLSSVAASRKIEPKKLGTLVRGELDWIVMKALEKDRARRYETAAALAKDVQHRLRDEPVAACPPSTWYRIHKFAQRNKAAMVLGAFISAVLVLAIAVTSTLAWGLYQKEQELVAELAEKISILADRDRILKTLHDRIIEDALMAVISGDSRKGNEMIRAAEAAGIPSPVIPTLKGLHDFYQGDVRQSLSRLEQVAKENPGNIMALSALCKAYLYSGNLEVSRAIKRDLQDLEGDVRDDHVQLLVCHAIGDKRLEQLDKLIEAHPQWALARVIRAEILRGRFAEDENSLARAVDDITWAREALPESPYAIFIEFAIYRTAMQRMQDTGGDVEGFRAHAEAALEELDKFPNYAIARREKYLFLWETGQKERAAEEFSIIEELGFGGPIAQAADHYRDGDLDKAFELRDAIDYEWMIHFDYEWMNHFQMLVVAELMGPEEAEEFYFSELKRGKRIKDMDPWLLHGWAVHVAALRLVCQDPDTIRAELAELREAREAADGKPELVHYRGMSQLTEFALGEFDQVEGQADDSRFNYFLALWHLGDGEKTKARNHLGRITEFFDPFNYLGHFAQALEARLDSNPNWPECIQK